jgi:hypothetical protein
MTNLLLLHYELEQAGLAISGTSEEDVIRPLPMTSWHPKDGRQVRIDWPGEPIQADLDVAGVVVDNHNPDDDLPWKEHKALERY